MIAGTYDFALVALSILIATAASYTALDLAGRIRASSGLACYAWLATAALAMGGGIWSMHFVAMLAFSMPGMEVHYDIGLTVLSLVLPIVVTGVAFFVVSRKGPSATALVASGLFMGLGIVAMHYTGMAAMRMPADLSYDKLWVAISVLIAIGASTVALWLALQTAGLVQNVVAAIAMGLAISGMHYAAMEAAIFTGHPAVDTAHGQASLGQTALALAVSAVTFFILFLALIAAMFDRRFAFLAEREAKALRTSEERFRRLYRRTPLPLHSLNAHGIVEQVSDAWLDLLGYSREEVIGRPLARFMMEESAEGRTEGGLPKLLGSGELKDVECRFVAKSGAVRDVLLSAHVECDGRGAVRSVMGGLVDVTDRKRAEDALRQAQKMEAVGQLTGGIAHDFNNLLQVLHGSLDLIRRKPHDPQRVQRWAENGLAAAERGAKLAGQLLAFSRSQRLELRPLLVADLIAGMKDLLARTLGPAVEVRMELDMTRIPVLADPTQLELAVLNLAINARDAMPEGGRLTVTTATRRLAHDPELPEGEYLELRVADTGTGMPPEVAARAFDPFFTTKGVGKGTGLGLSQVYGFARQAGGTAGIESQIGQGSTVTLLLRRAVGSLEAAREDEQRPDDLTASVPATVLVVDDDPEVRRLLTESLETLGYHAVQAESGATSLELLDRKRPDLLLVDFAMPGMNGAEVARAARERLCDLPVVFASGYSDTAAIDAVVGPDAFVLRKPFRIDELAAMIESALVPKPGPGVERRSTPAMRSIAKAPVSNDRKAPVAELASRDYAQQSSGIRG